MMLASYLKIALRTARRHPGYTFINVFGLAIGFAFCALVVLYVRDELSYDRFHEKADRIFRVNATSQNPEGAFYRTVLPPPVAPALRAEYPEVEAATRLAPMNRVLLRVDDEAYQEDRFYLADAPFFEVFSFPFVSGDPKTALTEPGSVVLTETMAGKYFGTTDPLGQIITFENGVDLTVAGVIEDVPANSHLAFDFLAALETPGMGREGWLGNWGSSSTTTYVLLRHDASPEALEAKLPRFVDTHLAESLDEGEVYTLSLHALPDIHLYPHLAPEQIWSASNLRYVVLFTILGVLILLIACINYVNLATARALKRACEVGVRKVLGSTRNQLLGQFLGESSMLVGAALLVTMLLVALSLPVFNALTGKALGVVALADPILLVGLLGMWLVVSLAAGSYPAFYLAAFRPAEAIRGKAAGEGKGSTLQRNGLVVVQFAAAVLLIVGTLVVHEQLAYMRHKSLGYDKEHVLVVPLRDQALLQNTAALKQEWLNIAGVREVALSSGVPNAVRQGGTARWEGAGEDEGLEIRHIMVDYDFMDVFGFEVVAGRGFSRAFPSDTAAYVLNEAAVRAIGWEDPVGKKFTLWGREAPVIGVVKDFHYESLHRPIGPLALHFGPQWYQTASLKIQPEQVEETLAAIAATFQGVAPDRPFEYHFLDETFDDLYQAEERFGRIATYLTVLALFVACLGLLGLTASVVEQRTKEIGLRKVLGASVPGLVALLTGEFARLVLIAFIVAAPLAYLAAHRWLEGFAYHIEISLRIFLIAGPMALGVALLTVSYQAIRAALTNPVDALRYE